MPLWVLSNWKTIAAGVAIAGIFFAGWHGHTIYDGYKTDKEKTKIITKIGKGQTDIVNFNQAFDKEKANAKDDCIDKPIPDGIRLLLK